MLSAGGKAQLIKALDGEVVLAEAGFAWEFGKPCELSLQVTGNRIEGWVNGRRMFNVVDEDRPLAGGGVALLVTEGRIATDEISVAPAG